MSVGLIDHAEELLQRRLVSEAGDDFVRALESGEDAGQCRAGLWMTAMLTGDFAKAWAQSDAIRELGSADPHRFWNGETLQGRRLIVRCLHGFGDAVQMLRFAPILSKVCESVVFEVAPHFLPLAPYFAGVDRFITWGDGAPAQAPEWDVQVEVMELPYIFRIRMDDLPLAKHYLAQPALESEKMGAAVAPRVGVVWAAGDWDASRSMPFSLMRGAVELPGLELWSLQGGSHAVDARGCGWRDVKVHCGDGLVALASAIAAMDLVITVDTLAAHLAGAMGRPVWLLLPHAADWRWMDRREESPWYPSMRIIRQRRAGCWRDVLDDVREALISRWG